MGAMEIAFYATLREITGNKSVAFDLPEGTSVGTLLERVVERFPEMGEMLFDPEGRLYGHVHVFINGRDAPYLDRALETPLARDDKVDIFPAIGGG